MPEDAATVASIPQLAQRALGLSVRHADFEIKPQPHALPGWGAIGPDYRNEKGPH